MAKLRVLTLVDGIGAAGGAETLAREVTARLDGERFERAFCVSRWSSASADDPDVRSALGELEAAGVRFIGLERAGRLAARPWIRLISELRRRPVDIIHAHKFGSNVWGSLIAPAARVPVLIAHEHSWAFEGRPMRRLLDRHLIGRVADVVVAVSESDRRRMIEIEGLDPDKVEVIQNGIPEPRRRIGSDVRAELGIAKDQPVIGTAATLRPYKAVDLLIRAAALVAQRAPGLQVLVAGGDDRVYPEVRNQLRELVAELGIEENVLLLGLRADVPDVIAAMDVAVCCSDFEGSPLSVMEYMEGGKAVVATAVGGIPDLIEDGVHGLLVPPRDPRRLAAAISELLEDPARRAEMGRRGRDRRRGRFSIDVTVREIGQLYERCWAGANSG